MINHIISLIYFSDISNIPGKSFTFQPKHNTHLIHFKCWWTCDSAAVVSFVAKALIPSSLVGKFAMAAVHVSALSEQDTEVFQLFFKLNDILSKQVQSLNLLCLVVACEISQFCSQNEFMFVRIPLQHFKDFHH